MLGDQPLVVDPGAYIYTADPAARNAFRSTAAHATLAVDGAEQNPLREDYLFSLPDTTRAQALAFEADGARATFRGRHHGYGVLDPPAEHERELRFDGDALTLTIVDVVRSAATHGLEWSLPLAPCGVELGAGGETATACFPGCRLEVHAPGLQLRVDDGWISPAYGVRACAPVLRAKRESRSGGGPSADGAADPAGPCEEARSSGQRRRCVNALDEMCTDSVHISSRPARNRPLNFPAPLSLLLFGTGGGSRD